MIFVLVLVFVAPAAALVLVVLLGATLLRLTCRRTLPSAGMVAATFGCLWVLVFAAGVAAGDLAAPRSASELCGPGRYDSPPLQERMLPLSHRCRALDGPQRELVPAAVNPALAMVALVGLAATAAAVTAGRRRPASPSPADDHPLREGTP